MQSKRRPVLLTGAHRSGTTWAGTVLSQSQEMKYIHEPFNIDLYPDASPFLNWFEYVNEDLDYRARKNILEYLHSFYDPSLYYSLNNLFQHGDLSELKHCIKNIINGETRALIKDPIAVMSAEWLASSLNADVVVLIRHPAAFVASIKLKNWEFDFNHFLRQGQLMDKLLWPFRDQIYTYANQKQDIISQGILLWNVIYSVVFDYKINHGKKWYFVKHEDLSQDPLVEFKKMCLFLNIEYTQRMIEFIHTSTNGTCVDEFNRNSKENVKTWTKRLSPTEINRIRIGTEAVAQYFYVPEDWL